MQEEYNFNLTVPAADATEAESRLAKCKSDYPSMTYRRKSDYKGEARFFMRFPLTEARLDLKFQEWFEERVPTDWVLQGPNYGRWGFK